MFWGVQISIAGRKSLHISLTLQPRRATKGGRQKGMGEKVTKTEQKVTKNQGKVKSSSLFQGLTF